MAKVLKYIQKNSALTGIHEGLTINGTLINNSDMRMTQY